MSAVGKPERILLGITLMVVAMTVIPIRDGIAKYLSADLSIFVIAWGGYVFASLIVVPLAVRRYGSAALLPGGLGSQTARTVLLILATIFYFKALEAVPLADAAAASFVAPFIAAALAPLVLKERTGWPIAGSVCLGFIGVLLVVRPSANFSMEILWAVGAGMSFALFLLTTRMAAQQAPALTTLSFQSLLGTLLLTPLAFQAGLEGIGDWLWFFVTMGVLQCAAHGLSITAFSVAPAGVLAPIVYVEIIAAVLIGLIAFGDWPQPLTWAGIGLIIAAGGVVSLMRRSQEEA